MIIGLIFYHPYENSAELSVLIKLCGIALSYLYEIFLNRLNTHKNILYTFINIIYTLINFFIIASDIFIFYQIIIFMIGVSKEKNQNLHISTEIAYKQKFSLSIIISFYIFLQDLICKNQTHLFMKKALKIIRTRAKVHVSA